MSFRDLWSLVKTNRQQLFNVSDTGEKKNKLKNRKPTSVNRIVTCVLKMDLSRSCCTDG